MLDFYEELLNRMNFIELDFDKFPYKLISAKGNELNSLIDSFLQDLEGRNQNKEEIINLKKDDKKTVTFIYENEKYDVFKNPIDFKFFYEDKIVFKAYNKSQLESILIRLNNYYFFGINNKFGFNIENILSLSDDTTEIILYPFFTEFFYKFNCEIKNNMNDIKIKKELLEPLQLYIENEEIKNKVEDKIIKGNTKLIDDELIFVYNEERKKFIFQLDDYARKVHIIEPYKIVGNDGIGKSLTLQFYSSIKLDGYYKLYFNLKLFEKYGLKDYLYIELMRGFLSREENKFKDDIKNYLDCVGYLQNKKDKDDKDFFKILMELILYLDNNRNKYIIILDQFKYEYISEKKYDSFKKSINKKYFRLIICCSLNDGNIKSNMFKDYESDICCIEDDPEEIISQKDESEKNKMECEDDDNDSAEANEENKINLKNIFIFKNRKESKVDKQGIENPIQISYKEKETEDKNLNTPNNNMNDLNKSEKSLNNNNNINTEINRQFDEPKYICKLPQGFPKLKHEIIPYQTTPIKIYYNNIVDLKTLIKEKEPEEIYNFMSNFKYLPKYYKKFCIFRKYQKLIDIKDNYEILENFKKKINDKIKKYIKNYYNKELNLEPENYIDNIYNYILDFKRKMNIYSNKKINFKELYKFSKKFPIKYIITKSEDELSTIRFDDSIIKTKFTLNYSFPFIEYALNNIIDEFDNDTKVNINNLSGSAFGYAFELKIRDYLNQLKEKIEIRKVWVLNLLSEKVKNDKLNEIKNKTLNSYRYIQLEDISNEKPLKDFNYFYFHPENQDNYLIDSILIFPDRKNNFSLIAFQITKYKDKDKIKSKKLYQNYIINNIKQKFENLYNIKITKAYLWFILSNEHKENDKTCVELDFQKIMYVFYSIEQKCFFKERNICKINNLFYFEKEEALIYPKKDNYYENIYIEPSSISEFEEELYYLSKKRDMINYEKIRKSFFGNNFGIKIKGLLKNSIIDKIKEINENNKNFYLLFLFCFPFSDLKKYNELNDNLIFILKYKKKIYLIYKNSFFEIDNIRKKLKLSKGLNIDLKDIIEYHNDISYEEKEIELEEMKDLKESHLVYLYKIYFIED